MAFRNIQAVLDHLATLLGEACLTADPQTFTGWRFAGEFAAATTSPTDAINDRARVTLISSAPELALSESVHPTYRCTCEMQVLTQPAGPQADPSTMQATLATVHHQLDTVLAGLADAPLVDTTDGIAAAYLIAAHTETPTTETDGQYYLLKTPFILILQF